MYRRPHDSFHCGPIPRRTPRGSPRRAQRRAQAINENRPDGYEEGIQYQLQSPSAEDDLLSSAGSDQIAADEDEREQHQDEIETHASSVHNDAQIAIIGQPVVIHGRAERPLLGWRSEAVNNSAALQRIMLAQLLSPLFIACLREDRTHRPTTNLHRRSLDDFNHSFEWSPGVLSFVTNPQMRPRSRSRQ